MATTGTWAAWSWPPPASMDSPSGCYPDRPAATPCQWKPRCAGPSPLACPGEQHTFGLVSMPSGRAWLEARAAPAVSSERAALESVGPGEEQVELYVRTYRSVLRSSGEIRLQVLERAHLEMESSLHPLGGQERLDSGALLHAHCIACHLWFSSWSMCAWANLQISCCTGGPRDRTTGCPWWLPDGAGAGGGTRR